MFVRRLPKPLEIIMEIEPPHTAVESTHLVQEKGFNLRGIGDVFHEHILITYMDKLPTTRLYDIRSSPFRANSDVTWGKHVEIDADLSMSQPVLPHKIFVIFTGNEITTAQTPYNFYLMTLTILNIFKD